MWGAQRNNAPPPVWVQKASRSRVFQTIQQYFESDSCKIGFRKWTAPLRYKVVYNEL